jgi:hypothetical protein
MTTPARESRDHPCARRPCRRWGSRETASRPRATSPPSRAPRGCERSLSPATRSLPMPSTARVRAPPGPEAGSWLPTPRRLAAPQATGASSLSRRPAARAARAGLAAMLPQVDSIDGAACETGPGAGGNADAQAPAARVAGASQQRLHASARPSAAPPPRLGSGPARDMAGFEGAGEDASRPLDERCPPCAPADGGGSPAADGAAALQPPPVPARVGKALGGSAGASRGAAAANGAGWRRGGGGGGGGGGAGGGARRTSRADLSVQVRHSAPRKSPPSQKSPLPLSLPQSSQSPSPTKLAFSPSPRQLPVTSPRELSGAGRGGAPPPHSPTFHLTSNFK